jgi:hypothetical protein
VKRIRSGAGKRGQQPRIGAPDRSLTPNAGLAAITELCDRLGVIGALDAAVGPVKQRDRGFGAGELLAGLAAAQLAGEDFLTGLDRQRADAAGQQLTPVPGLASTTAAGLARRITPVQWQAVESGLAAVTGRVLALLPAERAAALTDGPVTIDLDTTDVEVYGRKKRGVAYNHQGQRVGRPHVAAWAETEIVLAADLGDGTDDPRATAPDLLRRALAALPAAVRAPGRVATRADAGYVAGQLARAAHDAHISFAIGAKRIAPLWRLLAGIAEQHWHDAIGMDGAQVAVAEYCPDWWPADTRLLIRRVALDPAQVSAGPRSRRRRTLHPDQRALPFPELASAGAIYAYSFILTNLDVSTPSQAVAAEHWYRHRTTVGEHLPRQQARRRPPAPPIGIPPGQPGLDVGRAARRDHGRLAAPAHRHDRLPGHPGRARRARRQGHDRHPAVAADRRPGPADPPRPPPGAAAPARPQPAARGPGPAAGPARTRLTCAPRAPAPSPRPRPASPARRKAPDREPGADSRASSMPLPGIPARQDHLRRQESARRATRGIGSELSSWRTQNNLLCVHPENSAFIRRGARNELICASAVAARNGRAYRGRECRREVPARGPDRRLTARDDQVEAPPSEGNLAGPGVPIVSRLAV